MLKSILIASLVLGFCEAGTAGSSGRGSRTGAYKNRYVVVNGQRYAATRPTGFRTARRYRRARAQRQMITGDAVLMQSSAPPRRRFFSDTSVQFATGLNAGYGKAEPTKEGATRNALAFSIMFDKKLNDTFSICPEIAYVQRGVRTNLLEFAGTNIVGDVQLNYLELPLLIKARLLLAPPRWKLFFVAGPTVGLILNRQVEVLGLVEVDLSGRFNQADVGVVAGTGIEYQLTPETAIVGNLRYQMGLIDIDGTSSSFYTRGIQIMLGAQFRL